MRTLKHLALLAAMLPLAACFRMDVTQRVNADGTGSSKLVIDFTEMVETLKLLEELGSSLEEMGGIPCTDDKREEVTRKYLENMDFTEEEIEASCETTEPVDDTEVTQEEFDVEELFDCGEYLRQARKERGVKNATCTKDGAVTTLTTDLTYTRRELTIRKSGGKTHYIFRSSASQDDAVQGSIEIPEEAGSLDGAASEDEMVGGDEFAREILKGTYTLTMPGEITRANVGTYNGGTLTADLWEISEAGRLVVQSVLKEGQRAQPSSAITPANLRRSIVKPSRRL